MHYKILKYIGVFLLTLSVGSYIFFASALYREGENKNICRNITVKILDENVNRFVTEDEVLGIVEKEAGKITGKRIDSINIYQIESVLNDRSAIRSSQVSADIKGNLDIRITQRRPVLRVENGKEGFYVDETEYVFPLVSTFTSYVPVITGNIPVSIKHGFRGRLSGEDSVWLSGVLDLAEYLERNPFWGAQVQQIHIDSNRDIVLSTRVGSQSVIFGNTDDIEYKFGKLETFYKKVMPAEGWNKYKVINLKYRNQIVCE